MLGVDQEVVLDQEESHYARNVLRLRSNDKVTLFNGQGIDYEAEVIEVNKKNLIVSILDANEITAESHLSIHLGLGIAKSDKMDFSIQKSVELGVCQITPLFTLRTVVKLNNEKQLHKMRHWQKIAINACEQCGRTSIPQINKPMAFSQWILCKNELCLLLDPLAKKTFTSITKKPTTINMLIGPEGGFDQKEKEVARIAGFMPLRLGPRILRTETAAICALAAMQVLWGDIS